MVGNPVDNYANMPCILGTTAYVCMYTPRVCIFDASRGKFFLYLSPILMTIFSLDNNIWCGTFGHKFGCIFMQMSLRLFTVREIAQTGSLGANFYTSKSRNFQSKHRQHRQQMRKKWRNVVVRNFASKTRKFSLMKHRTFFLAQKLISNSFLFVCGQKGAWH